jgi:hypothetical protein
MDRDVGLVVSHGDKAEETNLCILFIQETQHAQVISICDLV